MAMVVAALCCSRPAAAQPANDFQQWLRALWPEAQRLGISRKVFDEATRGLEPDLTLPDLAIPGRPDKPPPGQAEFVQTPADYLNERSLARLAEHGRALAATYRETLARIEKEFGVPGPVVLAIFGRETDFGRYKLPHNALRVLSTQGYLGRRKDFFRQEFLVAVKMVEDGLARPAEMRSSWGGAMGLTQFLPSEFYRHAVDFDGDGRVDIFNSVPDALASAAKQLAAKGWQRGRRWAHEARAPSGFDCAQGVPEVMKPVHEWLRLGFVPSPDRKLSAQELSEQASVLQPEGARGPAFLTPKNYFVIKEYNFSDLYVLFVGQLADRIAGGRAAVASQPDGLVVSLPDADALGPSVEAAVAAGIPVITMNSGSDDFADLGALVHVGQTEFEAGQLAGQRMAEAGVDNALCINQEVGNSALDARCEGFTEGLGGTVEVIPVDLADPTGAEAAVAGALQAAEGINGILTLGPTGAAPTLAALESGGLDIPLATFDISPEVLDGISAGTVLFAIDQAQFLQGYLPIVLLTQYLDTGAIPLGSTSRVILTGPQFVTEENAADVVDFAEAGVR